jgi:hypothetical protein
MSSGESLCIIEATNSVVLNRFLGVAVLACIRLIISGAFSLLSIKTNYLNARSMYNKCATAKRASHECT